MLPRSAPIQRMVFCPPTIGVTPRNASSCALQETEQPSVSRWTSCSSFKLQFETTPGVLDLRQVGDLGKFLLGTPSQSSTAAWTANAMAHVVPGKENDTTRETEL